MKLLVAGATGLVGNMLLRVLEERNFQYDEILLAASEQSKGKKIKVKGNDIEVITLSEALEQKPDIALFSAGGSVSLEWAPKFAAVGTVVIDNSSAWRMDADIKLVVPEVNGHLLTKEDKIIANPNCSTIQLVMVLEPLHKLYGLKRVVISTYQSITGTGQKAVTQMMNERQGIAGEMVYPFPIDMNCLPHIDVFLDNNYTKEEMKMVNETRKIMGLPNIGVTATTVRIPVMGGHSESVNIEFENEPNIAEIRKVLAETAGIIVKDNPKENQYPMPIDSHDKDEVFVGRIRKDESQANSINLWIVADNLRKGAATNAVQIAENVKLLS